MTLTPTPESTAPLRIFVEVSAGELLDKITILEIKRRRLQDRAKLAHVEAELNALAAVRDQAVLFTPLLTRLVDQLYGVNGELWEIEDELREHEQRRTFDSRFIELARSVYRQNDLRASLKREINGLLNSRLVEEKGYASYSEDSGKHAD